MLISRFTVKKEHEKGQDCNFASLSLGDEGEERSHLWYFVGEFGRALGLISPSVLSLSVYSNTQPSRYEVRALVTNPAVSSVEQLGCC